MIFDELQSSAFTTYLQVTVSAPVDVVCTSRHLQDHLSFSSLGPFSGPTTADLAIIPILRCFSSVKFGSTPQGSWLFPGVCWSCFSFGEEFVKRTFIPTVDLSVTHLNRETTRPVESIVVFNDSTDQQLVESHFKT